MGIEHEHLRKYVIRSTLKYLGLHSYAAEELLVGTAAAESQGGRFLHQVGGGPAVGIYQVEPATHDDIWENYLRYATGLADAVRTMCNTCEADNMAGNLYYATAMARLHYYRVPTLLPPANDVNELARYWKQHYNTPQGKGTVRGFVDAYKRYTA